MVPIVLQNRIWELNWKYVPFEMIIKVHQYLINSYTTTTPLTPKGILVTTEMKATFNAQTRDNFLHTRTASDENASRHSEAQRKHC